MFHNELHLTSSKSAEYLAYNLAFLLNLPRTLMAWVFPDFEIIPKLI